MLNKLIKHEDKNLEALELKDSNSIEKKRSASLLLPYNNGKNKKKYIKNN